MKMYLMTSLFESFDLMNNKYISLNWIILIYPLMFMLLNLYWLIPSRINIWLNMLMKLIYNEFKSISMKDQLNILFFMSLMLFMLIINLMGLMPYIFSLTSHMSLNLSLSMPIWISFMIYLIYNNYNKFLTHLVPMNTPIFLMHFMVIIELLSNMIRPLTLAIRLTANLIAGHLLLILIGNFLYSMNLNLFMIIGFMLQTILLILELSMSFIQAYVFSLLSMLYYSESK